MKRRDAGKVGRLALALASAAARAAGCSSKNGNTPVTTGAGGTGADDAGAGGTPDHDAGGTPDAPNLTPTTLYLIGDSTVAAFNDPYYYPRYGWGTQIGKYLS